MKKHSYLSGVTALAVSSAAVKILGFLCKIPLLKALGGEGMGYYNTAYEIYTLCCVVSVSGLPIAMSVLSADRKYAVAIYKTALKTFSIFGVIGAFVLFMCSGTIADLLESPRSAASIRALSPAVLSISLSGVFRGYFQGGGNMLPTAVSQIIEAAGKLVFGVAFSQAAIFKGLSLPSVASYAALGITAGTVLSTTYLLICKLSEKSRSVISAETSCLKKLMATALPVTFSIAAVSLSRILDTALILRGLQNLGCSAEYANNIFGCYSTAAVPVFSLVPSFVSSVTLPLIPKAAEFLRESREKQFKEFISAAFGITSAVAIPSAFAFALMSDDILALLFSGNPQAVGIAYPLLRLMSLSVLPSCLITVTNAVLQSCNKPGTVLGNMLIGIAVKMICEYVLINKIGIYGAVIATAACDWLILILNFAAIFKKTRYFPRFKPVLKPILASACSFAVLLVRLPETKFTVIFRIAVIFFIYLIISLLIKSVPDEFLPDKLKRKAVLKNGERRKNKLSA